MTERNEMNEDIEADLLAYFQGQLDPERAFAVADYLAEHPERASDILSDMRNAEGLRLSLLGAEDRAPEPLLRGARRLQTRLRRQRFARRLAPIAAALVIFAAGWGARYGYEHAETVGTNPLVEAALDAQAALDLRHWMVSQPESQVVNSREIAGALGIKLPALPAGWTVQDIQVLSAPERPAVALTLDAPQLGRVLLFAIARNSDSGDTPLSSFNYQGRTVALFNSKDAAYVLVDNSGTTEQMTVGATQLMSQIN